MNAQPLRLPADLAGRLLAIARAREPGEGCGLLLGSPSGATHLVEVANVSPDLGRFEAHPGQWRAAIDAARERDEAVVAAWHSHVAGAAVPGLRDSLSHWGRLPVLLVAPAGRPPLRAWRRGAGGWCECLLQIEEYPAEEAPTPAASAP